MLKNNVLGRIVTEEEGNVKFTGNGVNLAGIECISIWYGLDPLVCPEPKWKRTTRNFR